jgi:hypothetical protein
MAHGVVANDRDIKAVDLVLYLSISISVSIRAALIESPALSSATARTEWGIVSLQPMAQQACLYCRNVKIKII